MQWPRTRCGVGVCIKLHRRLTHIRQRHGLVTFLARSVQSGEILVALVAQGTSYSQQLELAEAMLIDFDMVLFILSIWSALMVLLSSRAAAVSVICTLTFPTSE